MRNAPTVPEPTWPPTEREREDAQRREAVFMLRLQAWLVRKQGRHWLVTTQRRRKSRLVVRCRLCRRLVMRPNRLGPLELERMRLHLNLHTFATEPPAAEELMRYLDVKVQGAR